ncbi:MAG TPA: 1,4-dihydroxy-2-naphthoate polyprenyltransferase [Anaerolineaceae bacterium]|jgi:1,4-dihydroxy-2-naphthoate octaprenyltransferase|nr:1,4-dihydroxy-2-naphthoate polyprenyltransferase [Anaerolineaceae bacterium]
MTKIESSPSASNTQASLAQRWVLASRPRTLPAATAPVIVGAALAISQGQFKLGPALAALLAALLLQIGANLANDVFDFQKGADTHQRLGPLRVTQAGLLSPTQVIVGMSLTFFLAAGLGIYLAFQAGWMVIAIGFFAILAAVAYTGGPFPLGYNGLGEVFVFIFFGLAAVNGTYYVQAQQTHPLAWWASVAMGMLTVAILVVNNLRDIATDRASGKRTLAVRMGATNTKREYVFVLAVAYLVPLVIWLIGLTSPWVLLAWLSLPKAVQLIRSIYTLEGRPLNKVLAGTGMLELIFGVLFSFGLILS